ncbi:FAD-dependent oxidoreductase [Streptomyces sp. E5N91]|uniref:oxidoreductase n=1 Tax=Streptomyces sp. E5N91 TaxID=1851996 RepID=UPI00187D501C|nr:FAD-dependent oxidoreductase [Streptomyces sp. E5N91]
MTPQTTAGNDVTPGDPVRLGPVTAKNRIFLPPHGTNYSEVVGSARLAEYYRARAAGGVGLIVHEAVPVHPSGARLSGKVHGWRPESVEGFARVADAVREHDTRVFVQLYHVGRQMTPGKGMRSAWGPSARQCPETRSPVHPMTVDDIDEVVEAFATSSKHVSDGGLDGVEIHMANGYLLTAFMSAFSNFRTDAYGGSFENRMRLPLRVFEAVAAVLPDDRALGTRIAAEEMINGGLTVEDTCEILDYLRARVRIDYVSLSLGNYAAHENVVPDHSFPPVFNARRADVVRASIAPVPLLLAGRVRDAADAVRTLTSGAADMVGAVRPQIADPAWARGVLGRHGGRRVRPCVYCNQDCRTNLGKGLPIACSVNPEVGSTRPPDPVAVEVTRPLVVIGGGPAGMTAAIEARRAGRTVTLFEEQVELGGQLRAAVGARARGELGDYLGFLLDEVKNSGAEVRLGTRARRADLPVGADVVVATGGVQRVPDWAAAARERGIAVHAGWDVLGDTAHDCAGAVVVVDDGEDGWAMASLVDELVERGASVTLVTEAYHAGHLLPPLSVRPFHARLEKAGARVVPSRSVLLVEPGRVRLVSTVSEAPAEELAFDTLIFSGGHEPDPRDLGEWSRPSGGSVHVVGDAYAARGLGTAGREALEAVRATTAGH